MQTTYLKESLMFDQAASECHNMIFKLRNKRSAAEDHARENGEELPLFYDVVIDGLRDLREKYENEAEKLFQMHKQTCGEFDQDGIDNLMVAIAESWAADYEFALSRRDERKLVELLKEADNLIPSSIVERINRKQKEFSQKAHDNISQIISDTKKARQYKTPHGTIQHKGSWALNRCPLCGGAMYAVRAYKDSYKIKCTSCYLFEIVRVESGR